MPSHFKRLCATAGPNRLQRSLSVDLAMGMAVILAIILGSLLFLIYQRQSNILYEAIESKAEDYALKLGEVLAVPLWDFDDEQIAKIGSGFLQNELVRRLEVTNPQGDLVFRMESGGPDGPLVRRGADIRYNAQAIGHVEIVLSTASYFRELAWLRNVLVMVLAAAVAVFFMASGLLLRLFLRKPLTVLAKGMDAIARGEFDQPPRNLSYAELTGIAERFTQMASRIKAREDALIDINRTLQQVNAQVRQRFQYEQMLAEMSALAASDMDFDRFLNESLRLVGEAFGSGWMGIYRPTGQAEGLALTHGWSRKGPYPGPARLSETDDDPYAALVRSLRAKQSGPIDRRPSGRCPAEGRPASAGSFPHGLAFPLFVRQAFYGGLLLGGVDVPPAHDDVNPILETAVQIVVRYIESAQAREMLSRSEERFREMAEMLPETIFEMDREGGLTYVNPSGLAQFGYAERDMAKGLKAEDMFAEVERSRLDQDIRSILDGRETRLKEYQARHRDGSRFPAMISSSPIRKMGKITGIRGFVIDISEKKSLEERLRKAVRMEAIGNLAAGVAHDLNNILSGLVGYPDLLLLDLPAGSPMRPPIEAIKATGQKAAAVVQDLLTLARRNISELQVVNLNDVIDDYLSSPEFLQLKACHGNISVTVQPADDLMNVMASNHHLAKALMNLIVNAMEAMPAGGTLRVQTANRYVDHALAGYETVPEGEYAVLRVIDAGIGIARQDMPNIFEPFYTKKRLGRSGTGLGMSVVWATVKDHSGFVNVESREGQGTRFELYFPATRETTAPKPCRIPIEDYLGSEQILVVDDIPEQRRIAADMLARLGYAVHTVSDGVTAVEVIQQKPIDLVILDMIMDPGIDGLETFQRMLSHVPRQKAIIASGFAETGRVRTALQLGAHGYLKKPYTLEKLGLAVRSALDHDARPTPAKGPEII
jgi:PAS domain S-box-containing protein